jgi:predicted nucleic acid-binding protein
MAAKFAQQVLIAVDTNVLLDLADGVDDVVDAFLLLRTRSPGRQLVMPPTVAHELAFEATQAETASLRARGQRAFPAARREDIRPVDLVSVRHGIAEQVSQRLREAGLLPLEEVNDGLILGEAALLRCAILLTADGHLRGIPHEHLTLALQALDLPAPIIATPRELVRKFLPA